MQRDPILSVIRFQNSSLNQIDEHAIAIAEHHLDRLDRVLLPLDQRDRRRDNDIACRFDLGSQVVNSVRRPDYGEVTSPGVLTS